MFVLAIASSSHFEVSEGDVVVVGDRDDAQPRAIGIDVPQELLPVYKPVRSLNELQRRMVVAQTWRRETGGHGGRVSNPVTLGALR